MSITIRPYMAIDLDALKAIAADVFGEGYGAADLFDRSGNGIAVIKHDHVPVGFAVHRRMPHETMDALRRAGVRLPEALILRHHRNALSELKSIAIAPAFQKQGLGTMLMDDVMGSLHRLGQSVVVPAWKVDGHVNIAPLLDRFAFEHAGELRDIWKRECEGNAFACPTRKGAQNCRCSADIYFRVVF